MQDKLGEQNFHEDLRKLYEPTFDTIKITSLDIEKTKTETFIKNSKVLENINEKVLGLMNDKGMIVPYLASSLVTFFTPENKSQYKFIKDPNSTRMNYFLINTKVRVNYVVIC